MNKWSSLARTVGRKGFHEAYKTSTKVAEAECPSKDKDKKDEKETPEEEKKE